MLAVVRLDDVRRDPLDRPERLSDFMLKRARCFAITVSFGTMKGSFDSGAFGLGGTAPSADPS